MKRKAMLLEHVPVAARFATLSIALALGACSSVHSATDASAGQAAGGAAASSAGSDAAPGSGGQAGRGNGGLSGAASVPPTAGTGGANAAGGANEAGSANSGLGADCESSADCNTGLTCVPPTSTEFDGGGPAHGLCTLLCANDAACSQLEAGAGCFSIGVNSYCFQACTLGDSTNLANKCHGRPDFACAQFDTGAYCLPLCRADAECPTDRFCSPTSGLCEQTKAVGDPVGTACDPEAISTTCLGTCLRTSADGVTPVTGVCVELCSGALECMWDDAGTKPGGFCAGQLSEAFGPIDLGFCLPTCDCSGECPSFGSKCRAWTDAETELETVLGKPGVCYDSTEGSSELTCK